MALVAQLGTALAGIALLERMAPAMGQILTDNVSSVHSVETMLAVLAVSDGPGDHAVDDANRDADRHERFYDALEAAEGNVTEDAERASLAHIRRDAEDALAGDRSAREDVVLALSVLSETNQAAMHRAGDEAIRLGSAGRWALAFLALFGLGGSSLIIRGARRRLVAPLAELAAALEAYRSGTPHRRCYVQRGGELREELSTLNALLDRVERPLAGAGDRADGARARALVVALLDREGGPIAVVDAEGVVYAASREALDRIAEGEHPVADAIARDAEVALVEGIDLRILRL
jgi:hypothetical protein